MENNKFKPLNAARVLSEYIWKNKTHEKILFKIRKNKIEIDTQDILTLLMEFQLWQFKQYEK